MRTYYDVLGIAETATTEEIEAAYRTRLKETHPDVSNDEDAGEAVKSVIEARDVLTDHRERARYDRLGHEAYCASTSGVNVPTTVSDTRATASSNASAGTTEEPSGTNGSTPDGTQPGPAGSSSTGASSSATAGDTSGSHHAETTGDDRTTWDGSATEQRRSGSAATVDAGWRTSAAYAVDRSPRSSATDWHQLVDGQLAVVLLMALVCYPPLIVSTFFPPFPLVVNILVGVCTLVVVVYLVSIPEVGVLSFGFWTLITVVVGLVGNVGSLPFLIAVSVTGFPFVISLAVFTMVPTRSA